MSTSSWILFCITLRLHSLNDPCELLQPYEGTLCSIELPCAPPRGFVHHGAQGRFFMVASGIHKGQTQQWYTMQLSRYSVYFM